MKELPIKGAVWQAGIDNSAIKKSGN